MNDGVGVSAMIKYLKEKKGLSLILFVLIIGVLLMVFGSGNGGVRAGNTEKRVAELCERIDGVSDVSVMIISDTGGYVRGVAVVCSGGDDARIKLTLTEMICALFTVPSSSVSIVGGK